ncbi:DUF1838 family protein [Streptomyces sp. H27-S2]|uniref:DUF1838 family protein n=1 Tax=Streptomyces antarcticus TaxID=2996458 RepID=UPI00226E42E8|nr:DUF1838 family protein [Streptomyces sp. H27-S2]MCY0954216.1 DUF1838 family protein [Streptomyces sp. H27-S2]
MTPSELLRAFVRTRASLDGAEVFFWWTGDVYSWAPGEPYRRLFGFEGINAARLTEDEETGGFRLLTREAAFYLDPLSREILETWEDKPVIHVWNDPANQKLRPFPIPVTTLGDQVCFSLEIPLAYPSPLPVAEFPANSADDTYRALELFQFFAPASVLDADADGAAGAGAAAGAAAVSVPATMSWMRMSPYLPWMERGQRPGGLAFHCRGRKLDSYAEVPERTRAYIAAHHPEYAHAPEKWTEPNESSWTYFRKLAKP